MLAYGNVEDGFFSSLTSDTERIIVQVSKENAVQRFYSFSPKDNIMRGYIQMPGVEIFKGYPNNFTWIGSDLSEERTRPRYYLLDSKQDILYRYNEGLIYPSEKGILWTKFLVHESEIPKGAIFNNQNSQLI
ncbi:MAG: hypothetical protein ACK5KR_07290 [Breznakia sp.]